MRYFLYGYYGFGNFGDDLLLDVLISGIRSHDNDALFAVRAREKVPAFAGDPDVRFVLAESILEDRRHSKVRRFLSYRSALVAEVRESDVMVIGGGTLFIDKGRPNWSLVLLFEAVKAARSAGKKIVVTGVAIDILAHPLSVFLTQRIFAMADFSAVRDSLSLAYFQSARNVPVLSADLAWLKPLHAPVSQLRRRRAIALNLIDYFRSTVESLEAHRTYREKVWEMIERHRGEVDFHVIALQKGIGQRDDWFADELVACFPEAKVFYVDGMDGLAIALANVDAIITTRFHLALLAARAGVPVCIIDHELKLTSLAHDLSLPAQSLAEFLEATKPDPVDRLCRWSHDETARAASRMAARASVNFDWLGQ